MDVHAFLCRSHSGLVVRSTVFPLKGRHTCNWRRCPSFRSPLNLLYFFYVVVFFTSLLAFLLRKPTSKARLIALFSSSVLVLIHWPFFPFTAHLGQFSFRLAEGFGVFSWRWPFFVMADFGSPGPFLLFCPPSYFCCCPSCNCSGVFKSGGILLGGARRVPPRPAPPPPTPAAPWDLG